MKILLMIFILIAFMVDVSAASECDTLAVDSTATVSVNSEPSGATVILDSIMIGRTPLQQYPIHTGFHVLHYLHPDKNSWFHPSIVESLTVKQGEHIERSIHFPFVYHITSEPFGASVKEHDSVIGQTPMIFSTSSSMKSLTLEKEGYENASVVLPPEEGEVHLQLQPEKNFPGIAPENLMNERNKNYTQAYIVSGAAVVSGVVATYFKIKADGRYADYRNTGDTGILTEVHRYDTISGVALVSCQASLIFLSYLLLSK